MNCFRYGHMGFLEGTGRSRHQIKRVILEWNDNQHILSLRYNDLLVYQLFGQMSFLVMYSMHHLQVIQGLNFQIHCSDFSYFFQLQLDLVHKSSGRFVELYIFLH